MKVHFSDAAQYTAATHWYHRQVAPGVVPRAAQGNHHDQGPEGRSVLDHLVEGGVEKHQRRISTRNGQRAEDGEGKNLGDLAQLYRRGVVV